MANGHDASDWTVEHTGVEGAICCLEYRVRDHAQIDAIGLGMAEVGDEVGIGFDTAVADGGEAEYSAPAPPLR